MARGRPPKRQLGEATHKQIRDKLHYMNENAIEAVDASALSFHERKLLLVLADPINNVEKRGVGEICEAAGVSYTAYRHAMKNPEFTAALNTVVQNTIKQAVLPLVRAGVKYAMEGSFRHWETLLKMGGQIDADTEENEIVIRFAGAAAPTIIDAEVLPASVPGFRDDVSFVQADPSDMDPAEHADHTHNVRLHDDAAAPSIEGSNDNETSV